MDLVVSFILFPLFIALLNILLPSKLRYFTITTLTLYLGYLAINLFYSVEQINVELNATTLLIFSLLDAILLLYFGYVGIKSKTKEVMVLSLIQIALFSYIEFFTHFHQNPPILINNLTAFMLIVINVVGGIIIFYAIKYISYEKMSEAKKSLFVFYLTTFLGVMNLVVMSNDLMIFFFGFELTTLASYLLISFRGDDEAKANGIKALWMNQIGGVLILVGVILSTFSEAFVLIAILIVLAGLIKGAQLPFDSWLIGAMVAPTPVSAILHSATMVKLAPFITLKYSSLIAGSFSASLVTLFGAFVFVMAGYIGLSRNKFKQILGYSTIAMLGLMVSIAAIGSPEAIELVYILIIFHALSKALLFIVAGILEKLYGMKEVEDMQGLITINPFLTYMILIGFATIVLPPFGMFFGKLLSIEYIASLISSHPFYLIVSLFIALGSVILTLLYFKLASSLMVKGQNSERVSIPLSFQLVMITLLSLIIILSFSVFSDSWYVLIALLLIPLLYFVKNIKVKEVHEYNCAEKSDFNITPFNFTISPLYLKATYIISAVIFILILGASL